MKAKTYRFIFSALLICFAAIGKAQTIDGKLYTPFNNYYQWIGGKFNSNLNIPKVAATNGRDTGGIRYNLTDSLMYVWTGSQWRAVGSSLDTSSLSNRIEARVKYSDTAAMLAPYLDYVPTLQQVTTAGNTTTNDIIFNNNGSTYNKIQFKLNSTELVNIEQVLSGYSYGTSTFKNTFNSKQISIVGGIVPSISWREGANSIELRPQSNFGGNVIELPDSSGVLTQRVAINGTTYNTATNGVIDLGTIQSDTATVVKAYVTNAEAVTITKGQVVYIFGAQGDRASVKLAKNTSDTFSSKTLGIVRKDIAAGAAGWITTQGQVSGINLGAYSPGDILWLDSVPGGFTKIKPVAPYHSVFVGVVERANAGNGLIYVKPQNGQELGELHDTKITNPTNNQVLSYTAATGIWENKTVSVDTTSLSNRINLKLNISDTASMLNPYLRKADTLNITSLFNRASNKLEFLNEFYHLDNFITGGTAPGTHIFAQSTANKFSQGIINAQISSVGSRAFLYQNVFTGSAGPIHPNQMTGNPYIFETRVKVDTCTATDTLFFYSGLLLPNNVTANSYGTNYALFVYDPRNTLGQGASRFIQCVTSSSGTRTTNISTVLFSPTTFRKLRMEVKSTEVKFYIDGNLVATHTNNLPGGASLGMNYSYNFGKTVGSTTMNAIYDYWGVEHYFDTKR